MSCSDRLQFKIVTLVLDLPMIAINMPLTQTVFSVVARCYMLLSASFHAIKQIQFLKTQFINQMVI
jgi:hypothetical protein